MAFSKFIQFMTLTVTVCLLTQGCSDPTTVNAVPRKTSNAAKLHAGETVSTRPRPTESMVNGADVSFLTKDHFGCFWINPGALLKNLETFNINRDGLAEPLAKLIGPANANLDNLKMVWVVLDSEFFAVIPDMSGQPATSPALVVLDFNAPIDTTQLEEAKQLRLSQVENQSNTKGPAMEMKLLSDRRLAIGAPAALAKLSAKATGASRLIRDMQQLPSDSEITGVITMGPIRSTLQGVFDLLGNASPDAKKFADLPSDLQKLTLNLNFNNQDDFFELAFFIDNPSLKLELFQIANTAISSTGGGFPAGLPGVPMAGGLPINNAANGQLIDPESAPVLMQVAEQIQQGNLLKVQDETDKLLIKMVRPDSLPELIQAVINDSQRQFQLAARTGHFKKIAAALEQYEEQYGVLPSIQAHPKTDDLPGQLSWRVAILPMLGYQELYDRFDFDQAWDHPGNLKVAEDIPAEFQSNSNLSNIHLFSGQGGLHEDPAASPKLDQITDRKIWTAIAIEGSDKTALPWTQPKSIDNPATSLSQFGNENENAVLMIDASFNVRAVRRNLDKIQAVLSIDGGDTMKRSDFIKID
ncbi:MAG: DUF1559 domain-containing protein [Mariniblastus sp.]|nr:DUF1559 domain-containing protein [Mariniblastus sp.]